jgi:hypothetical protein
MLVKQIQNALSFAVCVYTTYNVYRYNTTSVNPIQVIYACRILYTLFAYLCFDLCINYRYNAFDVVIFTHHICGIIVGFYTIQFIDIAVLSDVVMTIGAVEISTVFLIIRNWLTELSSRYKKTDTVLPNWLSVVEPVNNMLFIGSFTYFRIYLFSKNIVYNDHFNTNVVHYNNSGSGSGSVYYCLFRASMCGLYALNIYWFSLILKSLSRSVKGCRFLSARNCEWALQYTYVLSVIYAIYTYSNVQNWSPIYYLDILGYGLLGISSYLYHRALYRHLDAIYPKTCVDTMDIMLVYLFDIGCINLRTWFTCYAHHMIILNGYLVNYRNVIVTVSGICHLSSFTVYCWYIYNISNKKETFLYETNDIRAQNVYIIIGIPITLSVLYGVINNVVNNHYIITSLLINIYVCGLTMFIKPFYQASHLVLHLLLLWQSVLLVNNNVPVTNIESI